MKKVFKNSLFIALILLLTITLTGCGNDEEVIDNNKQEEKEIENNNEIKLVSDDTKLVFNMQDIYYIVYYFEGNTITGKEFVYSYPDVETAKYTETMLRLTYNDQDNVKSFERHGKQIRISFTEDEYENETVESVKKAYSMLEELYKN